MISRKQSAKPFSLKNEKTILSLMIGIYCNKHHGVDLRKSPRLCDSCEELRQYSIHRLEACPFGEGKPVCSSCRIHCYGKEKREEIRQVMRFSGPRMILTHPILSFLYLARKIRFRPR